MDKVLCEDDMVGITLRVEGQNGLERGLEAHQKDNGPEALIDPA